MVSTFVSVMDKLYEGGELPNHAPAEGESILVIIGSIESLFMPTLAESKLPAESFT